VIHTTREDLEKEYQRDNAMSILISSIKNDLLLEIFWNWGPQISMDAL
jgi:hypothetical protein